MATATTPRRSHTRAYVLSAILIGLMLVGMWLILRNITDNTSHPLTTLNPQGKASEGIHDLSLKVLGVAGVIFVLVQGAVIFMVLRFRRHPDDVDGEEEPVQIHGKSALEWTWTAAPALLLAVLAAFNVSTLWDLQRDAEGSKMRVDVIGQQWWWEFRYDLDSDGTTDIITANQLVIPEKTIVGVRIRSNDVIHSFWIPALNGKRDAVPGRTQLISLQADQPGVYEGQCTEYCGLSHGYMRMQVKSLSAADYEAWVDNQLEGPVEPEDGSLAAEGKALFGARCANCHQINGTAPSGEATDSIVPDPDYAGTKHPLISGNAPNLTHLMSRDRFAGAMFHLYDSYEEGAGAGSAMPKGDPNVGELGDWLRNPPNKKPMAADQNRGMPNLNLTEDEISKLVAYLTTLE